MVIFHIVKVHLQMEQAMHTQQHTQEKMKAQHINTEMQHMKQAVGIQISRSLCIRTALSSYVEATIAMVAARE